MSNELARGFMEIKRAQFEEWYKKDPVNIQRKKLLEFGCNEAEIQKIEGDLKAQIERSIKLAQNASFSDISELYRGIYI